MSDHDTPDDLDLTDTRDAAFDRYLATIQPGSGAAGLDASHETTEWSAYCDAAAALDMARDPALRGDGEDGSPMTDSAWAAETLTFEHDSCPACGGHLITLHDVRLDQVYCLGCQRYADRETS